MDQTAKEFVAKKRIAVVGASRSGKKFGNAAYKELKQRGYQVYLVHPEAEEIEGETCYHSLEAVKDKVDGVFVSVPPAKGVQVLQQASQAGLKNIWIQQQGDSPEMLAVGKDLGLNMVHGKCILMYAEPVASFHSFHRFFVRLTGKY